MCIATSNSPASIEIADGRCAVVSPRLLRAYRQTRYTADGIDIRIGRRNPAMDAWLTDHGVHTGVLVTAWNPRSQRVPHGRNSRMQRHLAEHLHRYQCVDADSRLRRWREAQFLVLAPRRAAERIAMRFRQHAIVLVQCRRPARLIVLPDGDRVV